MTKAPLLAMIAALLSGGWAIAPVAAQIRNERALVVFGNDPCPRDTICVRKGESDRYRIPSNLRGTDSLPPSGADRAQAVAGANTTGTSGPGSCSAVAGGFTGCFKQGAQAARAERKAAAAADRAQPQ